MKQLTLSNVFFRADLVVGLMLTVLLTSFTSNAFAQNYPTHPIKIVVPYPPGAVGDIMIRLVIFNIPHYIRKKFKIYSLNLIFGKYFSQNK